MAISITNLTSGTDTDGGSSSTTASVSPGSNRLLLLTVNTRTNITANPNTPTITGNGLTWVQINSILYDSSSASRKHVFLFRAMGASPSAGTISIDFGGQAQTDTDWILDEVTGIDTSGTNGSGAIVQSATNKDETVTSATLTVTLAAFSSVDNATYGSMASDGNASVSAYGTGLTGIVSTTTSTNIATATEWKTANDTTVDITWDTNHMLGGVAIEIKAASTTSVKDMIGGFIPFAR